MSGGLALAPTMVKLALGSKTDVTNFLSFTISILEKYKLGNIAKNVIIKSFPKPEFRLHH